MDINGDGEVTRAELEKAAHMPEIQFALKKIGSNIDQLLGMLDVDGSGSISVMEFLRGIQLINSRENLPPSLQAKMAAAAATGTKKRGGLGYNDGAGYVQTVPAHLFHLATATRAHTHAHAHLMRNATFRLLFTRAWLLHVYADVRLIIYDVVRSRFKFIPSIRPARPESTLTADYDPSSNPVSPASTQFGFSDAEITPPRTPGQKTTWSVNNLLLEIVSLLPARNKGRRISLREHIPSRPFRETA